MFYRYLLERFITLIDENEHKFGNTSFSYAEISDEKATKMNIAEIVDTIGFLETI